MPMYDKKTVILPDGFAVGSQIYISGEGSDIFTVEKIVRDTEGHVVDIVNSSGWAEPLCKLCLIRPEQGINSLQDRSNWVKVSIGECDGCGVTFPDSCVYCKCTFENNGVDTEGILCQDCFTFLGKFGNVKMNEIPTGEFLRMGYSSVEPAERTQAENKEHQEQPIPHYLNESEDEFVHSGLRALHQAIKDFRLSGMTNVEISRALDVALRY